MSEDMMNLYLLVKNFIISHDFNDYALNFALSICNHHSLADIYTYITFQTQSQLKAI